MCIKLIIYFFCVLSLSRLVCLLHFLLYFLCVSFFSSAFTFLLCFLFHHYFGLDHYKDICLLLSKNITSHLFTIYHLFDFPLGLPHYIVYILVLICHTANSQVVTKLQRLSLLVFVLSCTVYTLATS